LGDINSLIGDEIPSWRRRNHFRIVANTVYGKIFCEEVILVPNGVCWYYGIGQLNKQFEGNNSIFRT
jgi:hypothetical protein